MPTWGRSKGPGHQGSDCSVAGRVALNEHVLGPLYVIEMVASSDN